jgi:hypothetical protein
MMRSTFAVEVVSIMPPEKMMVAFRETCAKQKEKGSRAGDFFREPKITRA